MSLNPFKKFPVPERIPKSLLTRIDKYSESRDKDITLKKCFDYVVSRQKGGRINIILQIKRLFVDNFEDMYHHRGFMYCTHMNYFLRVMLVKSGLFNDDDIEQKLTNTWYIMPHQYLCIRISEREYVNVDPWAYRFGVDFGNYGHGFKAGSLWSVR